MNISGWGRYPVVNTQSKIVHDVQALQELLHYGFSGIPMAMGRSYGDSALADQTLNIRYLNHFLVFDEVSGELTCESGVTLEDIINVFVPRGWFLPVTPGTKFVSVGGAIASDVHGKNHHQTGSFSQFVKEFKLVLSDGSIVTCSDENQPDLFHATFC
jgi:FAD/FMN-containing dehydrogenase